MIAELVFVVSLQAAGLSPAAETVQAVAAETTTATVKPARDVAYYLNIRKAKVQSPDYQPYQIQMAEYAATEKFIKTWEKDQEYFKALSEIRPFLDERPDAIEARRLVADAFDLIRKNETGDLQKLATEQSEKFRGEYQGLIDSILQGKDGLSEQSAFWVISIAEQHEVLRYLKLKPESQALVQGKSNAYDRWETTDDQGRKRTIYFEIGHFFAALEKAFSKVDPQKKAPSASVKKAGRVDETFAAEVTEALNKAAMVKLAVSEIYLAANNVWPNSNEESGYRDPENTARTITVGNGGVITIRFKTPEGMAGKSLVLSPTADAVADTVSWKCGSSDIDKKYLPSTCK